MKTNEPSKSSYAGRHTRIVALNLQTSGRTATHHSSRRYEDEYKPTPTPHRPGVDIDCILEVGVIVLDAASLKEIVRQSWLVLPPGVDTVEKFDAWKAELSEANPFVHDLHSTIHGGHSTALLNDLRTLAGATGKPGDPVRWTTNEITQLLHSVSLLGDAPAPRPPLPLRPFFDWGTVSPTNSDLMLLGHDLDGFILPMLQYWMSDVEQTFSDRKLDVLTFKDFAEIVKQARPGAFGFEYEPGPKNQTHRAMDVCAHAAESVEVLATTTDRRQEAFDAWVKSRTESEENEAHPADKLFAAPEAQGIKTQDINSVGAQERYFAAQERIKHLEMLVRYGRRGAIKEERKLIEAREAGASTHNGVSTSAGTSAGSDELLGLFRKTGGILRSKYAEKFEEVEGEDLDGDLNAGFNGGYIGVSR